MPISRRRRPVIIHVRPFPDSLASIKIVGLVRLDAFQDARAVSAEAKRARLAAPFGVEKKSDAIGQAARKMLPGFAAVARSVHAALPGAVGAAAGEIHVVGRRIDRDAERAVSAGQERRQSRRRRTLPACAAIEAAVDDRGVLAASRDQKAWSFT